MDQPDTRHSAPKLSNPTRFGSFLLNPETGELRKHGVLVRLQGKPFQILSALLENPGQVVTRNELRQRLWAADKTFVDFENGLNTAVNRLRGALGDSADKPLYVETLSRLGYRFIAPVESEDAPAPTPHSNGHLKLIEPAVTFPAAETKAASTSTSFGAPKLWISVSAAIALVALAVFLYLRQGTQASFQQITFHKGLLSLARFMPDGRGVAYSAEWNASPSKLFVNEKADSSARDLGLVSVWFAGFPASDRLAFFESHGNGADYSLETVPLAGGKPKPLAENAVAADWTHDGRLCLIREDNSLFTVEFPRGHPVYTSSSALEDIRISPAGDRLAFIEHPIPHDDAGKVMLINLSSGAAAALSAGWESLEGLSWNPSGKEVWFTAAREGTERVLYAADLRGHLRLVAQIPGGMLLRDISPSGKVLINRSSQRMKMILSKVDQDTTQDVSWLDWSSAKAVSADGKFVLFDESGTGGGSAYSVFLLPIGGGSPQRIGSGRSIDLSDDARWALTEDARDPSKLVRVSADGKLSEAIGYPGYSYRWAKFLPGSQEILFAGEKQGSPPGLYKQRLPAEAPVQLIGNVRAKEPVLDPSGNFAASAHGCCVEVYNIRDGSKQLLNVPEQVQLVAFPASGTLLTSRSEHGGLALNFLDLAQGRFRPFKHLTLGDSTGTGRNLPLHLSRDLRTAVFSRLESLSDLFIVSGWH